MELCSKNHPTIAYDTTPEYGEECPLCYSNGRIDAEAKRADRLSREVRTYDRAVQAAMHKWSACEETIKTMTESAEQANAMILELEEQLHGYENPETTI